MAKKTLLVPYKNGRPCWWDGEVSDKIKVGEKVELGKCNGKVEFAERRPITEFTASFEIVGFTRGRSSVKLCLVDVKEPTPKGIYARKFQYEVFLSDAIDTISKAKNMIVSGQWTFVKRGSNWGIKLIESDGQTPSN